MSVDAEKYDPQEDPASEANRATISDRPYYFIRDETYRSRRNLTVMSSLIIAFWWLELTPKQLNGFLIDLSCTPSHKFFIVLWTITFYELLSFGFRLYNDFVIWKDATVFITHNDSTIGHIDANIEFTILEHGKKATTIGGDGFKNNQYWKAMYKGLVEYSGKKMLLQKKQKCFLWGWEIGFPFLSFVMATYLSYLSIKEFIFPIESSI